MQNKNYSTKPISKPARKRLYIVIASVLALLIIGGLLYLNFHHTYKTIPTTTPSPTPASRSTNTTGSPEKTVGSTNTDSTATNTDTKPASTATLKAPSGTFISSHSPSLSNKESLAEASVCNTTVGATCEIQFTQGSLTQSLAAQTADAEGNVYWSWDVQTAGLTTGKWKITAIAKLGDKTLSTTDQLELNVQP